MLGSLPSDLFPYWDVERAAELVTDGTAAVPSADAAGLNASTKMVNLVRAAEGKVVKACREKSLYSLQQLRDLVYHEQTDSSNGQQILSLIGNLVWCHLNQRKRYSADSPQGKDPACAESKDDLDRLRRGERIFVLEGVAVRDSSGNLTGQLYGTDIPDAGILEGGRLHSNIDGATRFWGNSNQSVAPPGGPYPDDGENWPWLGSDFP